VYVAFTNKKNVFLAIDLYPYSKYSKFFFPVSAREHTVDNNLGWVCVVEVIVVVQCELCESTTENGIQLLHKRRKC